MSASGTPMPPPASAAIDTCQLCGSGARTLKFRDGPFSVFTCNGCGLVYVTPRLQGQALIDVYGADYWKSENPKQRGYADYSRESTLYLRTFERRMEFVDRWLPPKSRVLDVGCAAGYFLRVAEKRGHDVQGVEPSQAIAAQAVAALGNERIHVGTLETAVKQKNWAPGSFDLVTLWDVLEHVPEPQPLLRTVRELLKPSGRLLLETQNVSSVVARVLGRRWHHYKHDEHLYHFSPQTIRILLADCGFRVLDLRSGFAGKYVSLGFVAERAGRLGRIAGMLASPLRLLERCSLYVNPRDEIIVVAEPTATTVTAWGSPQGAAGRSGSREPSA
ncbi:MAG TPA: class I SAM-dependent methyltransferase [Planctomycetota bacterium]|nr:class I SAM-dependent methyltransferase [Planctomycetota bacterium]